MSYEIGQNYDVVVVDAKFIKSAKDKPVLSITFKNDAGSIISGTFWMTGGALRYTRLMLVEKFGFTEENLANKAFIDTISAQMEGSEMNISIVEDDYQLEKGKPDIPKVNYVNTRLPALAADSVVALFAGEPMPEEVEAPKPVRPAKAAVQVASIDEIQNEISGGAVDNLPF